LSRNPFRFQPLSRAALALPLLLALLLAAGVSACGLTPKALSAALPPTAPPPAAAAPQAERLLEPGLQPPAASPQSAAEKIIPTDPPAVGKPSLAATPAPAFAPTLAHSTPAAKNRSRLTSDLLFISAGRLIRWDPHTRYGVALAEKVVQFSASRSGKTLALLRRKGIAANGQELFDLELLDFETKQTQPLLRLKPDLADLALSPDGNWLAYRTPLDGGKIYAAPAADPEAVSLLGECAAGDEPPAEGECSPLVWSPDSKALLWTDPRGVWLAQNSSSPAENLSPGKVELSDPKGQPVQVEAGFSEPRWSPLGRFALVRVAPRQSAVSWHAVLDTKTGRLVQVIDSFLLQESDSSLAWLPDGRFVVAHASQPLQRLPAEAQLWSVVPTRAELLQAGQKFQFDLDTVLSQLELREAQNAADQTICLEWAQFSQPDYLGLGVRLLSPSPRLLLFELHSQKGLLTPLAELPQNTRQIRWSPDGTGVLLISQERRLTYLDLETLELIDLNGELLRPDDAAWLPPVLRK